MSMPDNADVALEIEKWKQSSPGQYVSHREIQAKELPGDIDSDLFRNAWIDDGEVKVDMPKARELVRERLRIARAPKLAALDVQFLRATESADAKRMGEIAAQKQALRDITDDPSIAAAETDGDLVGALGNLIAAIWV